MKTTVKRITIALTKEEAKMIKTLSETYQETQSQILKRGLKILHHKFFEHKNPPSIC